MKIVSLSGFIPEYIVDTVRFDHYVGDRNISHYCGYASDYISFVNDNDIDGIVFPKTCDSCRILNSYINKDVFVHQISVPLNKDENGVMYLVNEIKKYKEHLENHFQITTTESEIKNRISLINKRNQDLRKIYNRLDTVPYYSYLHNIHEMLKKSLYEQKVENIDSGTFKDKRGYIVGSFLSSVEITKIIEEKGIKIVGDNLPESGRLVSTPQVNEGDIYVEIAKSMINMKSSPSLSNYSSIIDKDIDEIKNKNVDCVFFIIQKYCEPYEYIYSVYKKKLDELKIPSLKIQLTSSTDIRKAELMIEAFKETLS